MWERPDPDQGHSWEWPSTPYNDEVRASEPPIDNACRIVLVGDCTVSCGYDPPANRPEAHLAARLRRALPDQPFLIRNVAQDGESARRFLTSGRIERVFTPMPRVDVAFVRYGINDRKEDGISGCIAHLRELCSILRDRYRVGLVVVETGIFVDYPPHYLWDRNGRLAPLYDRMRAFAHEERYPLVDVYRLMAEETARRNWDLRVRGLPDPEHVVVDDSFDAFYGDDPAFFTNIHPNSRCLSLIANQEVVVLCHALRGQSRPSTSTLPTIPPS